MAKVAHTPRERSARVNDPRVSVEVWQLRFDGYSRTLYLEPRTGANLMAHE